MPWFRVDDTATWHPKVVAAGNAAFGAWVRLGAYCNSHLTNGSISIPIASAIATRPQLRALVNAGLLHETDSGYQIHDYLQYQSSKEEITAQREATKRRVKRHRNAVTNAITNAASNGGSTHAPSHPIPDGRNTELNTFAVIHPEPLALIPDVPDAGRAPAGSRRRGRKAKPIAAAFDLERVYDAYPRKVGRKRGMETLVRVIQTQADFDTALRGAIAFAAAMDAERRPVDKIPYFSSWVNQELWRDYADAPPSATGAAAKRNWHEPSPSPATTKDVTDEL